MPRSVCVLVREEFLLHIIQQVTKSTSVFTLLSSALTCFLSSSLCATLCSLRSFYWGSSAALLAGTTAQFIFFAVEGTRNSQSFLLFFRFYRIGWTLVFSAAIPVMGGGCVTSSNIFFKCYLLSAALPAPPCLSV